MNGADVVAAVRADAATELDRLGSPKALVALTDASLDRETVLGAAMDAERRASETFAAWADDEPDEVARATFTDAAETEAGHRDRVAALFDDAAAPPDGGEAPDGAGSAAPEAGRLHGHLRELDGTAPRVGAGLVGRPLVADRSLLQVVNFFVNEGAEREADVFRELRADTEETVERGAEVLDAVCASADEYEAARAAAVETVAVAYDRYADRLTAMGVDPKPVC